MTQMIRWGILSTGSIAHAFAEGLRHVPDAELVAVGSRARDSAEQFGRLYDIPHRHASYEALAEDPDVDVIYIATPHTFHKENTLLCLDAGKAVLCEKPFAINAAETREMLARAREKNLFLMEAMWMRFLPAIVRLREVLAEGRIGEVRMVMADFGFRAPFDPHSRLFAPELGGGALLDVGIYPLSLACMILGPPERVMGMAHLGQTGVDEQSAAILGYGDGRMAQIFGAVRTASPIEARILGTEGRIHIHNPMFSPERFTVTRHREGGPQMQRLPPRIKRVGRRLGLDKLWHRWQQGRGQTIICPIAGNGYNYEAAEVMRCLRAGRLESDVMPWSETLMIMETLDRLRAAWGLRYPTETEGG